MSKITFFSVCKKISDTISEIAFLERFRKIPTAFTRNRKMPFCDIIYFIMSCANRSLQTELDEYFHNKGCDAVSRQAFSKARENIKHEVFIDLNDAVVHKFETEDGEIETYHGYRLFGVDGSIIDLPNTEGLRERFGYSTGSPYVKLAKGLAMTAFDVLNKITVFAELFRYEESERNKMFDISDGFKELYQDKLIWLLDRGYPSFALFSRFEENSQNFVVRVSSTSLKEVNDANEPDQVVTVTRNSTTLTLRVINVLLSSGEVEKLVTNLISNFTPDDFKELYAMRWGVETNYRFLKCKTLFEVFTDESETAILQDFHSSVLLMNMVAIAEREQEDVLRDNDAVCLGEKYGGCEYRANRSKLIGTIKRDFVKLMISKSKTSKIFTKYRLYKNIKRYAYLDIPDRAFPRNYAKKHARRVSHPKSTI